MAITLTGNGAFSYGAGPRTATFAGSVAAGTLIYVNILLDDDTQTPTCTDNLGTPTVYTFDTPYVVLGGAAKLRSAWGVTTVSGTPTISVDVPNHTGIRGAVMGFSGFTGTPSSLVTPADANGTGTSQTYAIAPSADSVLVSVMINGSGAVNNAASGWAIPDSGAGGRQDIGYEVVTAGSYSGTLATTGGSVTWYDRVYAFGVSGGGGGTAFDESGWYPMAPPESDTTLMLFS